MYRSRHPCEPSLRHLSKHSTHASSISQGAHLRHSMNLCQAPLQTKFGNFFISTLSKYLSLELHYTEISGQRTLDTTNQSIYTHSIIPSVTMADTIQAKLHNFLAPVTGADKIGFIDASKTSLYSKSK